MIYYWCLQLGYICIYKVSLCVLFEFCSRCFFSRVITVNYVYLTYAFRLVTVAFSNKFILFFCYHYASHRHMQVLTALKISV